MSDVEQVARLDRGPVWEAGRILVEHSSLHDHVTVEEDDWAVTVRQNTDIRYEMWGSGARGLWQLLCSIASPRCEVSLYEVVSKLDGRNRAVVGMALERLVK